MSRDNISIPEPTITPATPIQPFKYWVQRVLPTIYDDALSYQELWGKLVELVNEIGAQTNVANENVVTLLTAFNTLTGYVDSQISEMHEFIDEYLDDENIERLLTNILDDMVASGAFEDLITPIVAETLTTMLPTVVDNWLGDHIENPSNPPLTDDLSLENAAPRAKTVGDELAAVNAKIDGVSDQTDNLWENGDVYVSTIGYRHLVLKHPLPAGTYTISCVIRTEYDTTPTSEIDFSSSTTTSIPTSSILASAQLANDGTRGHATFTIDNAAYSVRIRVGTSGQGGGGNDANWQRIMVVSGSQDEPWEPPFTAIDAVARNDVAELEVTVAELSQQITTADAATIDYMYEKYKDSNNITARSTASNRGVTYAWNATTGMFDVTGTVGASYTESGRTTTTAGSVLARYTQNGCTLCVKTTDPEHLYLRAYYEDENGNTISGSGVDVYGIQTIAAPENAYSLVIRVMAKPGKTYNDTIGYAIISDATTPIFSSNVSPDMSSIIQKRLNTFKYCKLGPGYYKITGVDMPDNSMIEGCGKSTHIYIQGSTTYGFKLGKYNTIKNLWLDGTIDNSDIVTSEVVRNKHGILFKGNWTATTDLEQQPRNAMISNVWITHIAGGGITCDDTGTSSSLNLVASDCFITNCDAGINIPYYSEFHKFANITCRGNHYACVNNAGNNNFIDCDFSSNDVGYINKMVDGSGRSMPNNSHGRVIGCVIHHTAWDAITLGQGPAIWLDGATHGMLFLGCGVGYGTITIRNSVAIKFEACGFGQVRDDPDHKRGLPITIIADDGSSAMHFFENCGFPSQPNVTYEVENGSSVSSIWSNCYLRNGTPVSHPNV